MDLLVLHLVSIVVLCLPIIRGYWFPQITAVDEVTADYENDISDFVETIIEEKTCGGVISEWAEPRDPDSTVQMRTTKDCFMCNGVCYPVDELVNDPRGDVICFHMRHIHRQFTKLCHQFADVMNEKEKSGGGFYRCYGDDVHKSLGLPIWKPVCVCEGSNDINCISGFVKKGKCSIAVQGTDERQCDCLVNVNLQSWYRK